MLARNYSFYTLIRFRLLYPEMYLSSTSLNFDLELLLAWLQVIVLAKNVTTSLSVSTGVRFI
jgi:hypothetical protein